MSKIEIELDGDVEEQYSLASDRDRQVALDAARRAYVAALGRQLQARGFTAFAHEAHATAVARGLNAPVSQALKSDLGLDDWVGE